MAVLGLLHDTRFLDVKPGLANQRAVAMANVYTRVRCARCAASIVTARRLITRSAVSRNLGSAYTSYGACVPHENGATTFGGIPSMTLAPAPSTHPVVNRKPMPVFA